MKKLLILFAPVFLVGCLGDGGGNVAVDSTLGGEPAPHKGSGAYQPPYKSDETQVPSSPSSGLGNGGNYFDICMEACLDEGITYDYCDYYICSQIGGGPTGGDGDGSGASFCDDLDASTLAQLDLLGPNCRDCLCALDANTATGTECSIECGG
jgi:hypothetical protein